MKINRETARRVIVLFTLCYLLVGGAWFVRLGEREYMWYVGLILLAGGMLSYFLRKVDIPPSLLAALSLAGMMHLAGRLISVDGGILYEHTIFTIFQGSDPQAVILKYDQLLHFYGYGIGALGLLVVLRHYARELSDRMHVLFAVMTAAGIGSLNEIVEFLAVVFFATTYVGNYYNTSLDLLANVSGAIVAVTLAESYRRLKRTDS